MEDPEEKTNLLKILKTVGVSIYYISYLIYPFMPETSKKINTILNIEPFDSGSFSARPEDMADNCMELFKNGCRISEKPEIMFPRIKFE
jgi:methionyl-tRNA synthetase